MSPDHTESREHHQPAQHRSCLDCAHANRLPYAPPQHRPDPPPHNGCCVNSRRQAATPPQQGHLPVNAFKALLRGSTPAARVPAAPGWTGMSSSRAPKPPSGEEHRRAVAGGAAGGRPAELAARGGLHGCERGGRRGHAQAAGVVIELRRGEALLGRGERRGGQRALRARLCARYRPPLLHNSHST